MLLGLRIKTSHLCFAIFSELILLLVKAVTNNGIKVVVIPGSTQDKRNVERKPIRPPSLPLVSWKLISLSFCKILFYFEI